MRHADVDQTRLFAPADDLDGKAENRLGTLDELGRILGHAQGIGRHGAYRAGREPTQTLGKSPQRFQSTLLRLLIEPLALPLDYDQLISLEYIIAEQFKAVGLSRYLLVGKDKKRLLPVRVRVKA